MLVDTAAVRDLLGVVDTLTDSVGEINIGLLVGDTELDELSVTVLPTESVSVTLVEDNTPLGVGVRVVVLVIVTGGLPAVVDVTDTTCDIVGDCDPLADIVTDTDPVTEPYGVLLVVDVVDDDCAPDAVLDAVVLLVTDWVTVPLGDIVLV